MQTPPILPVLASSTRHPPDSTGPPDPLREALESPMTPSSAPTFAPHAASGNLPLRRRRTLRPQMKPSAATPIGSRPLSPCASHPALRRARGQAGMRSMGKPPNNP
ncbi:hypothetical protein VDGD_21646 [Verticillium dahliae]|nr:hypothetical protein VDGD_21646 [Verticillium dahliae]